MSSRADLIREGRLVYGGKTEAGPSTEGGNSCLTGWGRKGAVLLQKLKTYEEQRRPKSPEASGVQCDQSPKRWLKGSLVRTQSITVG